MSKKYHEVTLYFTTATTHHVPVDEFPDAQDAEDFILSGKDKGKYMVQETGVGFDYADTQTIEE